MEKNMGDLKAFLDPRMIVLFGLLVLAAGIDARSHRIPNWLTLPGTVVGLLYSAFTPVWDTHGFLRSFGGWAIGFGLVFPFYLMRMMGAGDVKLMAMAGAWLGISVIPSAVLGSFVAGGALALAYALGHRKFLHLLGNVFRLVHLGSIAAVSGMPPRVALSERESVGKIPFGVAIAAGTVSTVLATCFGFL